MYQKLLVALVVSLGYLPLTAQIDHSEEAILRNRVTRAIAQASRDFDETAYADYQKNIFTIKAPSYQQLRPLFEDLTVYNKVFADPKNKENKGRLANLLAKPVWAGWNTYRPIGMIEIFDLYFPQENKDAEITLLEYNVKTNLLSEEKRSLIALFENMNDENLAAFRVSYDELIRVIQQATSYEPGKMVEAFVPVIKAYNQLKEDCPEVAFLVKRSAFEKPIATGWGRVNTIEELRYNIGVEEMCGGDYICAYSPENLQKLYNVSAETAALFSTFVKNYNKDK